MRKKLKWFILAGPLTKPHFDMRKIEDRILRSSIIDYLSSTVLSLFFFDP